MHCLTSAWSAHASELRGWARKRLHNTAQADDLLQDIFLKSLRQGERFCSVQNARAWLFEVARNTLADHLRVSRGTVELPEDLAESVEEVDAVDGLSACLSRIQRARQRLKQQMSQACQVQMNDAGGVADFVPRK